MKIKQDERGVELIREVGDKALSHESTATHHLRRQLNEAGIRRWARFYPHRHGLTACRQGVRTTDRTGDDVVYWHERYQIEAAHKAFNAGSVFFLRANAEGQHDE